MDLSNIVLIVLVGISLGILILLSVFGLRPSAAYALSTSNGDKNGSLSTPISLGNTQDVYDGFFKPPGSTLSFFVYIGGRVPSAETSIIRVGDALNLKMTSGGPGSSPETMLVINQTSAADKPREYVIKCANIPIQKWTHVTIVREGRRFTLFYNGKVAADERTDRNIQPSLSQISVGDTNLPGEWALINLTPYAFGLDNINDEIEKNADTRGVPSLSPTGGGGLLSMFSCPGGVFCFSADTSQLSTLSPLRRWTTSYG